MKYLPFVFATFLFAVSSKAQLVTITRTGSDAWVQAGGGNWGGINSAENTNPVSASLYTTDPNPAAHGNSYAVASMLYSIGSDMFSQSGSGSIGRDDGYSTVHTSHGSSSYLWNIDVLSPTQMTLNISYMPTGDIDMDYNGNPSARGAVQSFLRDSFGTTLGNIYFVSGGGDQTYQESYMLSPGSYTLQLGGGRQWSFSYSDPNAPLSGSFTYSATATFAAVPEPTTCGVMLSILLTVLVILRRMNHKCRTRRCS